MLFMTYRPKAMKNVKAERITADNIAEIAASFNGTAKVVNDGQNPVHLKIATLSGILMGELGQVVVRTDDTVEMMGFDEFDGKFERARNVREG